MDALNSLPTWAQVAVGLAVFFIGCGIFGHLLRAYTEWRIEVQRQRWKRQDEAKAAAERAAFWAEGPSAVAEAIYWQRFDRGDVASTIAFIAANDEATLQRWLARDRFLLPAVEAARAAGIPINERSDWISAKAQQLRDEFNADTANGDAPWQ